jgi:hypothetical protein
VIRWPQNRPHLISGGFGGRSTVMMAYKMGKMAVVVQGETQLSVSETRSFARLEKVVQGGTKGCGTWRRRSRRSGTRGFNGRLIRRSRRIAGS